MFNGAITMNTLKKIKNLTRYSLLPLLAVAGLAAVNSSAQAACFGYPESTAGCKINGVSGACVGKLAAGDTIIVGFSYGGCTNPATSPLADTTTCVVRGLGGNDLISASSNYSSVNIICSGGGNDLIQGNSNNDIILGEAGLDIIIGGGGTNLLFGGSENDTLLLGGGYSSSNFNYGGAGSRDVCQPGYAGINVVPECEVKLP